VGAPTAAIAETDCSANRWPECRAGHTLDMIDNKAGDDWKKGLQPVKWPG
jgi:hypothetical protein